MLEQFRMRAGTIKNYFVILLFNSITVFLKRVVIFRSIHKTSVVRVQIRKHFFKRVKRLQCIGYFSRKHIINFFYGGNSFGIIKRLTGNRVAEFGANRASAFNSGFRSRSKGKNYWSCRYFTRNFNIQPSAVWYFYSLCYCHGLNIPQRAELGKGNN